jgi:putative acetyltransferase
VVFRAAVRVTARTDYSEAQVRAWAPDEIDEGAWATARAKARTLVAERDGAPVGFIDLEPDGHIDMLFVHPAEQRRGTAAALLGRVEAAAREAGIARLYTEASITARGFFERRGFRVVAPQTVELRGQRFLNYRMAKELA